MQSVDATPALTNHDSLELATLNRLYHSFETSLEAMSESAFWNFIEEGFRGPFRAENQSAFISSHPLYAHHANRNREGVLATLDRYGFTFGEEGISLSVIADADAIPTTHIQKRNRGASADIFTSDVRVLHIGPVAHHNGTSYNNRALLRDEGIWGDKEKWSYVASRNVSTGSLHEDHAFVALYIDKNILVDMRDVYLDSEGIATQSEFGHTFKFKGGIPKEAIKKVELLENELGYPKFSASPNRMKVDAFIGMGK